jgi:hypothetical protein
VVDREAAHLPHGGIAGRGLSFEQLGEDVLQHVGAGGGQDAPAPDDRVVAGQQIGRLEHVEGVDLEAAERTDLPAQPLDEHAMAEPVHLGELRPVVVP